MIERTNLSRATVTRYIKKLKDKKVLKRVGSDKSGYWEILSDN
jgi:ATP-dependent DNA helicase RecG